MHIGNHEAGPPSCVLRFLLLSLLQKKRKLPLEAFTACSHKQDAWSDFQAGRDLSGG